MQVTMNETYGTTAKGNNFFDVIETIAKKIATVFTPPKKVRFSNASVAEAIECLEWRVKYDQQRIVTHIYKLAALVQSPKICTALGIKEPTYRSSWFNDNRLVGIQSKTRELLESPKRHTVNPKPIDRFELTLAKFTGFYSSRTQTLMSGAGVANAIVHRSLAKRLQDIITYEGTDSDVLSLKYNMLEAEKLRLPARSQEQVVEEIQEPVVEPQAYEEQVEKVTPVTEPQEQITEQTTQTMVVKAVKKLSKKMTIKELKTYAKARGILVPGRKTKHHDIYEHIKSQLTQA